MHDIKNDADFKQAIAGLDELQHRQVAAMFVSHVLPLSEDARLERVLKIIVDSEASDEEIAAALKTAHAATFDSHARCGAEGHWSDQAGYFVSRAAVAACTGVEHSRTGGPAWQAAMSTRMAYTSMLIDKPDESLSPHGESRWQYQALTEYLNT
jgi:hypothetical protein